MQFKSFREQVGLLSPPDFQFETQEVEHREDPLTGSTCIINIRRAERAGQAREVASDMVDYIEQSRRGCFFCPEGIEQQTPKFLPHIAEVGRLRRGQAVLFPNLFPFAKHHAVATLSRGHYLDLDGFTPQMIGDSFDLCLQWLRAVSGQDQEAKYPIWLWNHMPPSAASIVHPHVQAMARSWPTPMQSLLLRRSREYYEAHGSSFWEELIKEERRLGQRFISEKGALVVLASFAPRGFREIQIIFRGVSHLLELGSAEVEDFASCVHRILGGYKGVGVGSFNLISFSGPIGERLDYYSLHVKIISRPFPRLLYRNDTGPLERLQDERVIETLPEDVARQIRERWGGD